MVQISWEILLSAGGMCITMFGVYTKIMVKLKELDVKLEAAISDLETLKSKYYET